MNKENINQKKWNYIPPQDKRKENTIGTSSLILLGASLSQIFNPVALTAAATYATIKTGHMCYMTSRKNYLSKLLKESALKPMGKDHALQKTINEMTAAADTEPHTAYNIDSKLIGEILPLHLRPLLLFPKIRKGIEKSIAGVLYGANAIFTTDKFLQTRPPDEIRFMVAHEIAHVKAQDHLSVTSLAKTLQKHAVRALTAGLLVTTAVSKLKGNPVMPLLAEGLTLAKGIILFFLASKSATILRNAAERIKERRADRNGIYLTRDPDAAEKLFRSITSKYPPRIPALLEMKTHPTYFPRTANMRKAFVEASLYPPLPTAAPPKRSCTTPSSLYLRPLWRNNTP